MLYIQQVVVYFIFYPMLEASMEKTDLYVKAEMLEFAYIQRT